MTDLFDELGDENIEFGLNTDYAKKYEIFRQKEELQKLKTRYGDDLESKLVDDDSSSSEEEDENAAELTQELEKDFFKTLSYLKKKDPSIYDESFKFFQKEYVTEGNNAIKKKKKDDKPMLLRDFERKIIMERNGKFSEDEDESDLRNRARTASPTIIEEQEEIKLGFKKVLNDEDDEDGTAWGGLFEKRKKTSQELKKENEDFREWLKGQDVKLKDKNVESDLKPLHDFWNDPKLDSAELFLKDYILNKKFLDGENKGCASTSNGVIHDSDEDLSEDEATLTKQEEFEHKFNFRFEEPDQEFIKRFPRTMENSMRQKDTRRKEKREAVKKRKEAEKERMKDDLKRLKSLKRKEILDKIGKLKEVTGNADFGFQEGDIEGDFDPDSYDKRMSELFTDDFYGQEECDEKPEFPDIDKELELENWEEWNENEGNLQPKYEEYEPHCEDADFNMDCDYDPAAQFQSQIIESTKRLKKKKKSKLAEALANKKPIFDPSNQSFEQYVDEYYGLDFEDIIGDLPCRFKYRKVVPNNFGLTVEEILKANDKELNQWCSLKKAVQHRPYDIEMKDIEKYKRRAKNINYKKKILTSLYHGEQLDSDKIEGVERKTKHKKQKNKAKTRALLPDEDIKPGDNTSAMSTKNVDVQISHDLKKDKFKDQKRQPNCSAVLTKQTTLDEQNVSKKRKTAHDGNDIDNGNVKKIKIASNTHELLNCNENKTGKKRKKEKNKSAGAVSSNNSSTSVINKGTSVSRRKKKNNKLSLRKKLVNSPPTSSHSTLDGNSAGQLSSKKKKVPFSRKNLGKFTEELSISNTRLQAYGLNPKKYKNFLKYGKT